MIKLLFKTKLFLFGFIIVTVSSVYAQQAVPDCAQNIAEAVTFVNGSETVLKDTSKAITLLKPCADAGNSQAQYILGSLYKQGLGVEIDQNQAFQYIQKAASQNHVQAVCELGVLYKDGIGCKLNFNTAIEWFEKAEALGNSKGSYSIGYMYFKGLGSIQQNYSKAIEWFQKSDYPMAKHWLGICNYFGYGMPVNKDRALELWLDNPIENSEVLLEYLQENPQLLDLGKENTAKASEFGPSKINEVIQTTPENQVSENLENTLTKEDLKGDWNGKLIELDWSKKRMNRSFPVKLSFHKNSTTKDLDYTFTINKKTKSSYGIFLDDNYYFDDLTVELPRLYQDDTLKYHLDYKALSLNTIEVKEIDKIRYLTAEISTSITDWSEPGAPMLLVLGNTKALTNNRKEIDEDLLAQLAKSKDDSFITLYPNPFKSDLLIQYDLAEDAQTSVEIHSFAGQFSQTVVNNEDQKAGSHLYHIEGSHYPNGLYVVRVITNSITYTKLIIKE